MNLGVSFSDFCFMQSNNGSFFQPNLHQLSPAQVKQFSVFCCINYFINVVCVSESYEVLNFLCSNLLYSSQPLQGLG